MEHPMLRTSVLLFTLFPCLAQAAPQPAPQPDFFVVSTDDGVREAGVLSVFLEPLVESKATNAPAMDIVDTIYWGSGGNGGLITQSLAVDLLMGLWCSGAKLSTVPGLEHPQFSPDQTSQKSGGSPYEDEGCLGGSECDEAAARAIELREAVENDPSNAELQQQLDDAEGDLLEALLNQTITSPPPKGSGDSTGGYPVPEGNERVDAVCADFLSDVYSPTEGNIDPKPFEVDGTFAVFFTEGDLLEYLSACTLGMTSYTTPDGGDPCTATAIESLPAMAILDSNDLVIDPSPILDLTALGEGAMVLAAQAWDSL